jgi:hypothetical protein
MGDTRFMVKQESGLDQGRVRNSSLEITVPVRSSRIGLDERGEQRGETWRAVMAHTINKK